MVGEAETKASHTNVTPILALSHKEVMCGAPLRGYQGNSYHCRGHGLPWAVLGPSTLYLQSIKEGVDVCPPGMCARTSQFLEEAVPQRPPTSVL